MQTVKKRGRTDVMESWNCSCPLGSVRTPDIDQNVTTVIVGGIGVNVKCSFSVLLAVVETHALCQVVLSET